MNRIEQAVAEATIIYMPKGKEAGECTDLLRVLGIDPPLLNDDIPQGWDNDGRVYTRMRASDGIGLLERGVGDDKAISFAGSDVCEKLIDANPDTNLEYFELDGGAEDKEPMCTLELLLPKEASDSLYQRLRGEGTPVTAVTSLPRMAARCALIRGLNITPIDYVPAGNVEIMVRLGMAEAAVDLVTSGRSAEAAGLRSSKTEDPNFEPDAFDPILQGIYGAVVLRKAGAEYKPRTELNNGIDAMDATLVARYESLDDSSVEPSDTIKLLGSVQKALGKSTEEGLEMALAVLTGEGDGPTVSELADRVRADALFVNSLRARRGETPITYRALLEELISRNQRNPRKAVL